MVVLDTSSFLLEALRIYGKSLWRAFSSKIWSRTLALVRFGLASVSQIQTTGDIREEFISIETDTLKRLLLERKISSISRKARMS